MKKLPLLLLFIASIAQSLNALQFYTIHDIDKHWEFRYSLISDLHENVADPEVAKGLEWMRGSAFVIGGGDDMKSVNGDFINFIQSDSYYRDNFYPTIGRGEDSAFGSGSWGASRKLFNSYPGFWSRPNVTNAHPYEVQDAYGNTPSYYSQFTRNDITVHVLSLYSINGIEPPLSASTMKFLKAKLEEVGALKQFEYGSHMLHVHANRQNLLESVVKSPEGGIQVALSLLRTADLITDSHIHQGMRHWWTERYFEETVGRYSPIKHEFEMNPNAALWMSTGAISRDGYLEFHFAKNPLRFSCQYINLTKDSRVLVEDYVWPINTAQERRSFLKEIDGPVKYLHWNKYEPGNDAVFISQNVPSTMEPGETQTVSITMKHNRGDYTWSSGAEYSLGSLSGNDWGVSQMNLPHSVVIGQEVTFTADITAPELPGVYNFKWKMRTGNSQNPKWFGQETPNLSIQVEQKNIVKNPSFEIGGVTPESWSLGSSAIATVERSQLGLASLKLNDSSSPTTQTIGIIENTDYEISVWIDASQLESGIAVFDTNDVFDGVGEGQFVVNASSGGWAQYSGSFNSGTQNSLTLRIFSSDMRGLVYFDNIFLEPTLYSGLPDLVFGPVPRAVIGYEFRYEILFPAAYTGSYVLSALNLPSWLKLSTLNDRWLLSGIPTSADMGVHNVELRLSNGMESKDYAFNVAVEQISGWWLPYNVINSDISISFEGEDVLLHVNVTLSDAPSPGYGVTLHDLPQTFAPGNDNLVRFSAHGLDPNFAYPAVIVNPSASRTYNLGILSAGEYSVKLISDSLNGLPINSFNTEYKFSIYRTQNWDLWKQEKGVGDIQGDDDGDGISNYLEYALGGNPKQKDSERLPEFNRNGQDIEFKFHRGQESVTYIIQKSCDLIIWEDFKTIDDNDATVGSDCSLSLSLSGERDGRCFYRLKVQD